jgi:RNA polymerase sigma-70 factor (ECF subfamily)
MSQETCWTLLRHAAEGDASARAEFGRHYLAVVRKYLRTRWHGRLSPEEIDDAVGEVFVECLKDGGLLARARQGLIESFHACFYGTVRNVALRFEERRAYRLDQPGSRSFHPEELAQEDESLDQVFERSWAQEMMRKAAARHRETARSRGPEAEKRVRLLDLRFEQGLPIRKIAELWGENPSALHHAYARARHEFQEALREVVAFHDPGPDDAVEEECRRLLALLR